MISSVEEFGMDRIWKNGWGRVLHDVSMFQLEQEVVDPSVEAGRDVFGLDLPHHGYEVGAVIH